MSYLGNNNLNLLLRMCPLPYLGSDDPGEAAHADVEGDGEEHEEGEGQPADGPDPRLQLLSLLLLAIPHNSHSSDHSINSQQPQLRSFN